MTARMSLAVPLAAALMAGACATGGGTLTPAAPADAKAPAVLWRNPGAVGSRDLFWGAGEQAEAMAGPMRQQGTYWVIVPRAVGERWLAQQAGS